ncbi:MAG TPA: hypothetical protein VI434_04065 [Candidatus Dormibacteraeota bacterium]
MDETSTLQRLLSDLYQGPLDEFVARRTRLVRETRTSDPEAAGAIGRARKPPISVWAIDQLAIDDQNALAELLAASADASDAQQGVADQSETRETLLAASGRLRDAVERAARGADAILERAGNTSSDDTRRRIQTTLHAAATGGRDDRLALWHGTLDHEIAPSGFGTADGVQADTPELAAVLAPLRHVNAHSKPRPRVLSRERDKRESDKRAAREAAERASEQLRAAAVRARDLAKAKRLHVDTLSDELRAAEQEAATAEKAADEAERAVKSARSALPH